MHKEWHRPDSCLVFEWSDFQMQNVCFLEVSGFQDSGLWTPTVAFFVKLRNSPSVSKKQRKTNYFGMLN